MRGGSREYIHNIGYRVLTRGKRQVCRGVCCRFHQHILKVSEVGGDVVDAVVKFHVSDGNTCKDRETTFSPSVLTERTILGTEMDLCTL
jgi:hypothetical protein